MRYLLQNKNGFALGSLDYIVLGSLFQENLIYFVLTAKIGFKGVKCNVYSNGSCCCCYLPMYH